MAGAPFVPGCDDSRVGCVNRSTPGARSTDAVHKSEPGSNGQNANHLPSDENDHGPACALTPARRSTLPLPSHRVHAKESPDRNAINSPSGVHVGKASGSRPFVTRDHPSRPKSYTQRFCFSSSIMATAKREPSKERRGVRYLAGLAMASSVPPEESIQASVKLVPPVSPR